MQLSRYAVGSVGEEAFGFCQAVRRGPHVAVSGSTGRDVDGRLVPGGAYAQTRQAIENLQTALAAVGGSLADVIRTRVFIVDITEGEAVARAHCEAFAHHPPASSLIGVNALFEPDVLVQIEADAIIADGP
ncbi:MAG TPA: Rid family hydrolase [Immundisolibacter sp.]